MPGDKLDAMDFGGPIANTDSFLRSFQVNCLKHLAVNCPFPADSDQQHHPSVATFVLQRIQLYFFTDAATAKDVVLLPALCHDLILFSIALQLLLIALIICYLFFKAVRQWLASISRAKCAAREEEAADPEPKPKFRVALPPPCKCLRWAVKWDPDIRNMINCLKEEGEEALIPFFECEVFVYKLRKIVRNMVSVGDRMRIKHEVLQMRQREILNERTAQKTAEQEMQDRRALLELFQQADEPAEAAQAPPEAPQPAEIEAEPAQQAPQHEEAEDAEAAPLAPPEGEAPDDFLKMLIATSQKKPTDPQMTAEDAAALASMMAE
ncbi:unnamed protein product, partial [Symbiodinium natans]